MRRRGAEIKGIVSGLTLLALSLSAHGQRPVREKVLAGGLPPVLRRAIVASATLRFTGRRTVTVLREGKQDRHEEVVLRDGPNLHIEFPEDSSFAGQVIVENAKERRHFLPLTNEVVVLPPRREEGLQRLRALSKNGRLTTERGDRIAGYNTIEVTARDAAGNMLQRLAIEPVSGLVLRRRIYNATGTEVGGYVYTKVDLNPGSLDAGLFKIERRGVTLTTPWDQLRRLAKRSGFSPVGLPASSGFRLDTVRVTKLPEGQVLLQNYVGPGGRLSFYQLQASVSPARLRRQGRGKVRTLSWTEGGRSFVFVGPQDDATLAKLKGQIGSE